eukprot:GHVS01027978.1.p1 GENE.GHVS01027978.1~~GHVS01027978.1.p1  ORF type:complete len:629 (-),score=59.77 GHVS01027978.1:233-1945(-)
MALSRKHKTSGDNSSEHPTEAKKAKPSAEALDLPQIDARCHPFEGQTIGKGGNARIWRNTDDKENVWKLFFDPKYQEIAFRNLSLVQQADSGANSETLRAARIVFPEKTVLYFLDETSYGLGLQMRAYVNDAYHWIRERHKDGLDVQNCRRLAKNLTTALYHLHNVLHIGHNDVNLKNILLDAEDHPTFLLADFGAAERLNNELVNPLVTNFFMPPEAILSLHQQESFLSSDKIDIFSFGRALENAWTNKMVNMCSANSLPVLKELPPTSQSFMTEYAYICLGQQGEALAEPFSFKSCLNHFSYFAGGTVLSEKLPSPRKRPLDILVLSRLLQHRDCSKRPSSLKLFHILSRLNDKGEYDSQEDESHVKNELLRLFSNIGPLEASEANLWKNLRETEVDDANDISEEIELMFSVVTQLIAAEYSGLQQAIAYNEFYLMREVLQNKVLTIGRNNSKNETSNGETKQQIETLWNAVENLTKVFDAMLYRSSKALPPGQSREEVPIHTISLATSEVKNDIKAFAMRGNFLVKEVLMFLLLDYPQHLESKVSEYGESLLRERTVICNFESGNVR